MTQLIHPELSYAVRGVLLNVYNALGPMLKEEFYEQAIAIGLEKRGIHCDTQKTFEVYYEDERVGLYYVDVWIEDGKILLELKVGPRIESLHRGQAISYLKVTNADLAIVANYDGPSLEDERLPNFVRDKQPGFDWQPQPFDAAWLYPDLTDAILRACHRVHFVLGPGFLHQVYRRAVMVELRRRQLNYIYIKHLPIEYEGHVLGRQDTRLMLIEDKVLLATYALHDADATLPKQLRARMRRLNVQVGLLANFHDTRLEITPVRLK